MFSENPRHSEDETHVVYWVFYNYWLNLPSMCSRKRLTVARHSLPEWSPPSCGRRYGIHTLSCMSLYRDTRTAIPSLTFGYPGEWGGRQRSGWQKGK